MSEGEAEENQKETQSKEKSTSKEENRNGNRKTDEVAKTEERQRGECQGYQRRRKKEPSQSNQDTERDKELAGVSCRGLNRLWVDEAIRVASTFRR